MGTLTSKPGPGRLSRRDLIRSGVGLVAVAGMGVLATACGSSAATPTAAPAAAAPTASNLPTKPTALPPTAAPAPPTAALAPTAAAAPAAATSGTIGVGVLHSLSGTMAISEVAVKNAELMAIDEINASGGVMGKKIVPNVEDG